MLSSVDILRLRLLWGGVQHPQNHGMLRLGHRIVTSQGSPPIRHQGMRQDSPARPRAWVCEYRPWPEGLPCWGQGALGGAQEGEGHPHSVVAPENGRVPFLAFQMGNSYLWVSTIITYC